MQITFIVDRLSPQPGGVKTLVTELANRLSVDNNVLVAIPERTPRRNRREPLPSATGAWSVLLHRQRRAARLLSAPADYVALPVIRRYGHGRAGLPAARLFGLVGGHSLATALPQQPDVVHAFTADMTGFLAIGLGRTVDAPVVCTGVPHPGQYGDGLIDRSVYGRADGVIALSAPDRDVYIGLDIAEERITVIPPPSEDLGTLGRERARKQLGITGALVVFAGARRDYKGAGILHAAAPLIGARIHGACVAFVGPGEALPELPGVSVRDVGEVDRSRMSDWIRAADVLVLPSQYETCSIVVLEAWSAGVPVVVSDIPTMRHQVEVSGGGIAVPRTPEAVGEAVVALLDDDLRRRALGGSGRRYWEANCGIKQIVEAHEQLYARLVSQRRESGNARQR